MEQLRQMQVVTIDLAWFETLTDVMPQRNVGLKCMALACSSVDGLSAVLQDGCLKRLILQGLSMPGQHGPQETCFRAGCHAQA